MRSPFARFDSWRVTDKKFPGNPTRSYRSGEPIRVVGELPDWVGHPAEQVQALRDAVAAAQARGEAQILG